MCLAAVYAGAYPTQGMEKSKPGGCPIYTNRMDYLHDRIGSGMMLAGTLFLNLISMIDKGLVTFVLGTIATLLYIANQLIALRKNTRKKKEQEADNG